MHCCLTNRTVLKIGHSLVWKHNWNRDVCKWNARSLLRYLSYSSPLNTEHERSQPQAQHPTQSQTNELKQEMDRILKNIPSAHYQEIASSENIPPEKYSLSRGLALNKFEKDFFIYPEYSDSESANNIKSFVSQLKTELTEALSKMKANDTTLSDTVLAVLKRNALSSANVPAEYEGMGMCNKDLLCLSEVLGLDFNVYMRLLQIQRVVTVITLYGSEEQKQTLLPKIASGALKPAILLFDENGNFDFESIQTSAIASGDGVEKISGTKSSVIGVADANLFLVFAMRKSNLQQKGNMACYIIEREHLPQQSCLTINSRINTLGLNALHVSDVELKDVPVNSSNLLGSVNDSRDIALELSASNGYTYGAAVVGFLKLLIGELSHFCNTTIQFKSPLSENLGIQRSMTDLCMSTFVLESMSYYVGGLLDEHLVIATDIESAIIHKYANSVLRLAISTTVDILGSGSVSREMNFEKWFRDAITMISLSNNNANLTEQISMGTLTTWAKTNAQQLRNWRLGKVGALKRLFGAERDSAEMNDPKLTHFIAEHAHPSLENACRDLEQTMSRLNIVISKLTSDQGKTIQNDFMSLSSICSVVENNLGMVAVISRATRSYSIGLRNADLEVAWALTYCSRAARQSHTELNTLLDYFGLVRFNPSMLQIGRAALDLGGYCLESPIEKNW